MRVTGGGGLQDHGECIEVLALPLESAESFVLDAKQPKSPGLMFGVIVSHALKDSQVYEGV